MLQLFLDAKQELQFLSNCKNAVNPLELTLAQTSARQGPACSKANWFFHSKQNQ